MVKIPEIYQANASFGKDDDSSQGLICVFAGATSNIGASALEALAEMLQSPTFYVLGRSATRFATQREKLLSLNPQMKLVFFEVETSLISDIDAACKKILDAEKRVDYLYMSQGCIPLNVPQYTKEGLEITFALSYYTRMRLLTNLLPLLRCSTRPRVLSVLNAGQELKMQDEDIGLQTPGNFGPRVAINHTTTMMTLGLEYLSQSDANQNITFIHSFPGLVASDNFSRLTAPNSFGLLARILVPLIGNFFSVIQKIFGISTADCGARQAFLSTSDRFEGGKTWRIDDKSEVITSLNDALEYYRESGWREKVFTHTLHVFEKATSAG
ncbi:putative short-chain dehydrogenases protein [Botrytis fragariae]|uniref:Putative short-chain dehydrogenases protein n=1 Tax=Botrytis fragariae TaxID=1964551 RepID=A0A8H6AXN1_9HELO|nr:putative short-chain dehydrogenases protein [Botrytis fragariae]KAF5875533.1 putative short-chain dehydrogenases protein [Botrytis fragariae]